MALWPLVITVAAILFTFSFVDSLPEQVATHWGSGGEADGFTDRERAPWFALLGLVMGWGLGGLVLALGGHDGIHRRLGVGLGAGIAAFISGVMVSTLWIQRGLAEGAAVGPVDTALTVAMAAALLIGVAAAFTVPGRRADDTTATEPVPADAPRAPLPSGGPLRWSGTAQPARAVRLVLLGLPLLFLAIAVLSQLWLFMALMAVLVLGLTLGLTLFRVSVTEDEGLVIRGLLGVPTWRVPLSDVAQARATTVSPFAEFGGWGYRLGLDGRTGFVVRAGEALEVTRGDGSRWVVTVDDAERAAGLLNALADRTRRQR